MWYLGLAPEIEKSNISVKSFWTTNKPRVLLIVIYQWYFLTFDKWIMVIQNISIKRNWVRCTWRLLYDFYISSMNTKLFQNKNYNLINDIEEENKINKWLRGYHFKSSF